MLDMGGEISKFYQLLFDKRRIFQRSNPISINIFIYAQWVSRQLKLMSRIYDKKLKKRWRLQLVNNLNYLPFLVKLPWLLNFYWIRPSYLRQPDSFASVFLSFASVTAALIKLTTKIYIVPFNFGNKKL